MPDRMPSGVENQPDLSKEKNRAEKPTLTAYVIRHGQTEKDKTKKARGLTEQGEREILEATDKIISELNPETDIIQLLDSDTPRTKACNEITGQRLAEAGFKFFTLIKMDKSGKPLQSEINTSDTLVDSRRFPKIKMPKISETDSAIERDPNQRKKYNIPDSMQDARMAIWYAMAERGENFQESETPQEVAERMEQGIERTKKDLPMLKKLLKPGQRIVVIINANAPQIDSLITKRTGKNILERGEVKNAEGFKIDFSLSDDAKGGAETIFEEWPRRSLTVKSSVL